MKTASDDLIAELDSFSSGTDVAPETLADTQIVYGADNGLTLINMRGLDFDDSLWDDLLDELTADEKVHDDYRIDYLRQHIKACREAITDGVDLFGYSPWSAFDLISTHQGITKRYGFIYINRDEFDLKDMKRIRKDSFYWYQKVCKSNGQDLD